MTQKEQREIFNRWLKRHKGLFFKVINAYAVSDDDKNDLMQEISIQVWRSIPNFRGESAETTWLYRIALNTSLKWKGKEQKHSENRSPIDHANYVIQESKVVDDRVAWIYQEISKMNEVDKSLCLLILEGFAYKEIAEILGLSENHVSVKIHRIKKELMIRSKNYF